MDKQIRKIYNLAKLTHANFLYDMAEPIQFPEEIVQNEDRIEQPMQQQDVQQLPPQQQDVQQPPPQQQQRERWWQRLATWRYVVAFDLCANV